MPPDLHPKLVAAIKQRDEALSLAKIFQDFIDTWDKLPIDADNVGGPRNQNDTKMDRKKMRRRSGRKILDTQRLAHSIIFKANRSLSSHDLFNELIAQGLEFPGKSPQSTMSARLSGSELVEFGGREGWRLTALGNQTTPEIDSGNIHQKDIVGPAERDDLTAAKLSD